MMEVFGWYISVFLMAATPWIELLVVIPIGIGAGLDPFFVGLTAFVGNALPVFLIVAFMHRVQQSSWYERVQLKWQKRTERKQSQDQTAKRQKKQKNREKVQRIFQKYGLPGLAISGPGITGIHLATIFALALESNRRKIIIWMNVSLLIWTILMTVASFYGIEGLMRFFT
ncbi:small multi-drug export protein [Salsuginibacillus kocurii]|uniref:small multi-drug export protein n=1 Tax=Salsuginibacillus kocurii TaxID=427078 RepID=UPI0003786135|nr:small multi-drug export protein [Salsuginibacillus kocurii]